MGPSSGNVGRERARRSSPTNPEIWLVNDDPAQLLVQKRLLGRFASTVWDFSSPLEALAQARQYGSCPNLVADVQMPGLSGLELARAWCELHPDARILLISASPLSAAEAEDATFLPTNRVKLLTEYRIPELLTVAREWFDAGGSEEQEESEVPAPLYAAEPAHFDVGMHAKLRGLGGTDFLTKALRRFDQRLPERLEACRNALRDQDYRTLHREAHSLKGSCGVVGASTLWGAADRLESAAQEGGPDPALRDIVAELVEACGTTQSELVKLLDELKEA